MLTIPPSAAVTEAGDRPEPSRGSSRSAAASAWRMMRVADWAPARRRGRVRLGVFRRPPGLPFSDLLIRASGRRATALSDPSSA